MAKYFDFNVMDNVTKAEFLHEMVPKALKKIFTALDANKNGLLSKKEIDPESLFKRKAWLVFVVKELFEVADSILVSDDLLNIEDLEEFSRQEFHRYDLLYRFGLTEEKTRQGLEALMRLEKDYPTIYFGIATALDRERIGSITLRDLNTLVQKFYSFLITGPQKCTNNLAQSVSKLQDAGQPREVTEALWLYIQPYLVAARAIGQSLLSDGDQSFEDLLGFGDFVKVLGTWPRMIEEAKKIVTMGENKRGEVGSHPWIPRCYTEWANIRRGLQNILFHKDFQSPLC